MRNVVITFHFGVLGEAFFGLLDTGIGTGVGTELSGKMWKEVLLEKLQ